MSSRGCLSQPVPISSKSVFRDVLSLLDCIISRGTIVPGPYISNIIAVAGMSRYAIYRIFCRCVDDIFPGRPTAFSIQLVASFGDIVDPCNDISLSFNVRCQSYSSPFHRLFISDSLFVHCQIHIRYFEAPILLRAHWQPLIALIDL